MTNSDEEAKQVAARLEKVPEVLRVMSLDSFVPEDQPAEAEADRAGRQGARPRAQSGFRSMRRRRTRRTSSR